MIALTSIPVKGNHVFSQKLLGYSSQTEILISDRPAGSCGMLLQSRLSAFVFAPEMLSLYQKWLFVTFLRLFLADSAARVSGFQRHHEAGVYSLGNLSDSLLEGRRTVSVEELLCRRSGGVCCREDLACMLSRPRATLSVNYLPLLSWYPVTVSGLVKFRPLLSSRVAVFASSDC